ncbi:hypothetical protein BB560_004201 [Smittium megazygosporum]|uniref:Uncharacterized protein n=1 Tax=Smittium megazygosporum TaxID=133381 RepID=A0A2T9Z9X4_9FUNG|nr:hypothetical protein BB560_004201 [Smittium megazygosporum]
METIDKNTIHILDRALKDRRKSIISAFVLAILSKAQKDYKCGYLAEPKRCIVDGIADFTLEKLDNQDKILTFQCKITTKEFALGRTQLKANMINGGYPHGILICGEKTEIYKLDISKDDSVPVFEHEYDNNSQLHELIQFIRDL